MNVPIQVHSLPLPVPYFPYTVPYVVFYIDQIEFLSSYRRRFRSQLPESTLLPIGQMFRNFRSPLSGNCKIRTWVPEANCGDPDQVYKRCEILTPLGLNLLG
jgi:hypothetical protein